MPSNFQRCLRLTLQYEGGYSNHPKDPGGETNFGITKDVARANGYLGAMRSIPMSVVERIYRNRYWRTVYYDCDALEPGVDLATFDFGVNSGPSRAYRYLTKACGGPAVDTVRKLCKARLGFLKGLGTWSTFGRGWARRVAGIEAQAVKMALEAQNKPKEAIREDLRKEAEKAAKTSKKQGGGAVAIPTTGGASGLPSLPEVNILVLALVAGVILLVSGVLIYRAYVNHERSKAYAKAAAE